MSGVIGRFFFQFGVTITVAVLLSLVEALTLTPMRCSQFVNIGKRTTRFGQAVEWLMDKARDLYAGSLAFFLGHRITVMVVALIIFGASFSALSFLKQDSVRSRNSWRSALRFTVMSFG